MEKRVTAPAGGRRRGRRRGRSGRANLPFQFIGSRKRLGVPSTIRLVLSLSKSTGVTFRL